MDFAPYQDTDPERVRALSPPPANRALSPSSRNATKSPPPQTNASFHKNPPQSSSPPLPNPNHFSDSYQASGTRGGGGDHDVDGGRFGVDVNLFETTLPLRLDYEAMLAYLLLPPAGGVFLLIIEHKSDYVRYANLLEHCNLFHLSSLKKPKEREPRDQPYHCFAVTDCNRSQIPRLAIFIIVLGHLRSPSHLGMVQGPIVDAVRH